MDEYREQPADHQVLHAICHLISEVSPESGLLSFQGNKIDYGWLLI